MLVRRALTSNCAGEKGWLVRLVIRMLVRMRDHKSMLAWQEAHEVSEGVLPPAEAGAMLDRCRRTQRLLLGLLRRYARPVSS